MFLARLSALALLLLSLSGCSVLSSLASRDRDRPTPPPAPAPVTLTPEPAPEPPAAPPSGEATAAPDEAADLWTRLRAGFRLPGTAHHRTAEELRLWRQRARELGRIAERGGPYLHFILTQVEARGLPAELALLPVVESGFDPRATSPFDAAGLWQFMPATARHYGLRRDWWYDGRRDLVASTAAALDYLEYLNRLFDGDWLLSLAAYNAGEGTVSNAVASNRRRGDATDYWSLDLPVETRDYVPRLLALSRIFAAPAAHGVRLPPVENAPGVALVELPAAVELALAAELTGLDTATIEDMNPGYLRWATAPAGPHRLLLPTDHAPALTAALAEIPHERWVRWHRHRVRPGDSLYVLARRYGTSVAALQRLNGMGGTLLRVGRDLKVPRVPDAAPSPRPVPPDDSYVVRRGDSLWTIARRHGLAVGELVRLNGLGQDAVLQPGQRLRLATVAGSPTEVRHVVRAGDTLWHIARRFDVRISDLTRWNDLARDAVLRPGQVLVLYPRISPA